MGSLAWVLGIGFLIGFLLKWPKRTLILIASLSAFIAVIGGGIWGFNTYQEKLEDRLVAKFELIAAYDTEVCDEDFPVFVLYRNGTSETVTYVSFRLEGYLQRYSTPLYRVGYPKYSSDLIVEPGKAGSGCWRIPEPEYRSSEKRLADNPPVTLSWRVIDFKPTFEKRNGD